MKNKALIIAMLLSAFSLSVFAKVDCSDPKNRPRDIGGILRGGKKRVLFNSRASKAQFRFNYRT